MEALREIFVDEVREQVSKRAMATFAKSVDIVPAKLGDFAATMGAAALVAADEPKD